MKGKSESENTTNQQNSGKGGTALGPKDRNSKYGICKFFLTPRGCLKGDECNFSHLGAPTETEKQGLVKTGKRERACFQWEQNGNCSFGDRCRFQHDNIEANAARAEGESSICESWRMRGECSQVGCPHAHALVGITDDGLDAFTILASATGNVGTGMGGEKNMGRAQAGNWSETGSFVVVQREEGKREMTREDRLFMVRGVHDEVMSWNAENRKGDVVGNRDGGESMNDDSHNTPRDSRDMSCEMSKIDRPHDENGVLGEEKHAKNGVLGEGKHAKGKGNEDKERDDEDGDEKEKRSKETM